MPIEAKIPNTINPDLKKERENASFNSEEFAQWWYGGADKLKFKRELETFMFKDLTEDNHLMHYKSHEDMYDQAVKQSIEVAQKLRKLQNERNPGGNDIWPGMYGAFHGAMPAGNPFSVQYAMVVKAIKSQGTDEQFEKFGKRVENFNIGATYAQTELGHGTFLRGLETRADYDPKTDEFILNTPQLTSYKWWPGGLGHSSNYCIVVANLFINGESKGVQMFFVPVRDEETHMPLPGVDIGEIGKKLGFYGVNNGFLGLKNVRVPRENMLMRNAKVLKNGEFIKSPSSVLTYFTMVFVRCWIVRANANMLTMAATIATRYSAVRRQSPINPDEREPQIIDHVTQQLKLFPEIATGMAYNLAAESIWQLYQLTSKEIEMKEYRRLPELHALVCAMKALCTADSCTGIEKLRLACGGHGYLISANLGPIYMNATAACTYEGENTVLLLQVGRFLVKSWRSASMGQSLAPTVSYFNTVLNQPKFGRWTGSRLNIIKAFQYAAAGKSRVAYESYNARVKSGQTEGEAANHTGIEFTQAAELHGRLYVCQTFLNEVTGPNKNKRSMAFNNVLENLLDLFLVNMVFRSLSDILRFINITDAEVQDLQYRLEDALKKLRPDAVAICDGFDYHDRTLSSTLGSYDGNVYERLFDAAKKSPLNQKPVPRAFHEALKPFMKSSL